MLQFYMSPTGETGRDLWFALRQSVSPSVRQSHFWDPAITLKLVNIFS